MKVAFSPVYKYELPEGHRFPMIKYELLPQQLLLEGVIEQKDLFTPGYLTKESFLLTHTLEYWNKLSSLDLSRREIRDIGFPVRKELIDRGRYIARGTIECALYALEDHIALNIAGGTHHAYADRGEGFCIYNDFAIAARYLLHHMYVNKILVIDLDVHQGNGTAQIFKNQEQVFTCSVHGEKNYPLRKEKSDLDIGLKDKVQDDEYLEVIRSLIPRLIDLVKPDIIFYLAGVDILESDKLGRLSCTIQGCKKRDLIVFQEARKAGIPIAVSMGGGYSTKISTIINAHANTYKAAKEIY